MPSAVPTGPAPTMPICGGRRGRCGRAGAGGRARAETVAVIVLGGRREVIVSGAVALLVAIVPPVAVPLRVEVDALRRQLLGGLTAFALAGLREPPRDPRCRPMPSSGGTSGSRGPGGRSTGGRDGSTMPSIECTDRPCSLAGDRPGRGTAPPRRVESEDQRGPSRPSRPLRRACVAGRGASRCLPAERARRTRRAPGLDLGAPVTLKFLLENVLRHAGRGVSGRRTSPRWRPGRRGAPPRPRSRSCPRA